MVRLKPSGMTNLQYLAGAFQFLYGAIKTSRFNPNKSLFGCFNSSMVRLKPRAHYYLSCMPSCFNSSMVRLKLLGCGD